MNERCDFVMCVPIDTDIDDMDIIGSCTEAVVVENGVVYEIKHGEGEPVRRPVRLTEKELAEFMEGG